MNSRFTDDSLTWRKLCRAAAMEQDPDNLSQIVQKINSVLRVRQRRLRSVSATMRGNSTHVSSRLDRAA